MNDLNTISKTVYISVALFIICLITGILLINDGIFHHDGIVLAKAVEDTCRTGQLHSATKGRYGCVLVNSIIYFPFYLLGQRADFYIRFSSLLFHALSIVAFFLLIYEFF